MPAHPAAFRHFDSHPAMEGRFPTSRGLPAAGGAPGIAEDPVEVIRSPDMVPPYASGRPLPFARGKSPGGNGFGGHLPICVRIHEREAVWWRVRSAGRRGHVGLVHHVSDGILYTIEGNRTSCVAGFDYVLSRMEKLLGYGHVP